jgi:hypothetical protein
MALSRGAGASSSTGRVLLHGLALLLIACTPKPVVEPSGFLGDYSHFEKLPDRGNALRYQKTDLDLAQYEAFILDTVIIDLRPDSDGQHVEASELIKLSRYLHAALQIALREAYPVVAEPGAGVARLRVAITDVEATRPAANTAGTLLVPLRVVSASKRAVSGTDLFVGSVAIEAELVDSLSGERLIAVVDRKAGDKFHLKEGATTWGAVERAFREWAVGFRRTLDEGHGRR